ncbi:substrate-binding periplasmic protein [Terasakiella sp.]|uniref:substrate-binding periplasmic protein n=1 Tax=Terasakiella sp. TaxID=2034861 RepID=UPI003AA7EA72
MIKIIHYALLVCFCLAFLCASKVTYAQNDVVKLATFSYPPLFHSSEKGDPSGTVIETVTYMCELADMDCQIEILPFKRAYQKLENKLVDGLITIKVDQFEKCCTHTNWETPWIAGFFSHKSIVEIPKLPDEILGQRLITVAGMRSPYEFMPRLDEWSEQKKLTLFSANNAYTATRMFLNKRADYLWGSEDFYWYFNKQTDDINFTFLPLVVRPIVVWIQKDRPDILARFNATYEQLMGTQTLDHKKLLIPELMDIRYQDAPFDKQ